MKAGQKRGENQAPSFMEGLLRRIRELTGRDEEDVREALEDMIEEAESRGIGRLPPEERTLLLNAVAFGELRVDDVMVPRADIEGIDLHADLAAVIAAMQRSGHSRLVVYRGTLDEVVGIVHVKDLLPFWGNGRAFSLAEIVRPVLVVPPSMRVLDLLLEMRRSHQHVAIVVDEFGGTDGLVTIEDICEEIVGELQDEHERAAAPMLVDRPDGAIEADARVDLEELEDRLGIRLLDEEEREDVDTVGGLIYALVDRIPEKGEVIRHPAGIRFEILDADPRRIRRVLILRSPDDRSAEGETR